MSGSDDESDEGEGKRQFRLLGVGFIAAGAVILALSNAANPQTLLVALFGFLGFAALVLERTQDVVPGVSFGLFTGGIAVWLWPTIRAGAVGYDYLGMLVIVVGVVNVAFAPVALHVRRFSERLASSGR